MTESLPLLTGNTQHTVSGNGHPSSEGTGPFRCSRISTSATGLQENNMTNRRLFGNITFDPSLVSDVFAGEHVVPNSIQVSMMIRY